MGINELLYNLYSTSIDIDKWPQLIVSIENYLTHNKELKLSTKESEVEIIPHLEQILQIITRQNISEEQKIVVESSLSVLPVALYTLSEKDQRKTIQSLNRKAEILFPKLKKDLLGFFYSQNTTSEQDDTLPKSEHVIKDEQTYFFLELPLKSPEELSQNPVVMVSLSHEKAFDHSGLFEYWRLSKKETAICRLLLEGESIQSISAMNSRSIHTIRSQVKSILQKCDCHSQLELVRKFYTSPLTFDTNKDKKSSIPDSNLESLTIKLPDNRTLSWSEQGAPDGKPIILCHSMHQSRLTRHPDTEVLFRHRIRLIIPDRPGYGRSDPNIAEAIPEWDKDLIFLLNHLDLQKVAIVGLGLGTQFALLCAQKNPDQFSKVIAVNPAHFIKRKTDCQFQTMASQSACRLTRKFPRLMLKISEIMGRDIFLETPQKLINQLYSYASENDHKALSNDHLQYFLKLDFAESNRQGFAKALIHELHFLLNHKRIFQPELIQTPVTIYYFKQTQQPNEKDIIAFSHELPDSKLVCDESGDEFIIYHLWEEYLLEAVNGI